MIKSSKIIEEILKEIKSRVGVKPYLYTDNNPESMTLLLEYDRVDFTKNFLVFNLHILGSAINEATISEFIDLEYKVVTELSTSSNSLDTYGQIPTESGGFWIEESEDSQSDYEKIFVLKFEIKKG